jgi:hypothetical protein
MPLKMKQGGAICEWNSFDDQLSTDDYVDVGIWSVAYFKTKILTFVGAINNLKVNTLYSLDGGTTFTALESDIAVAAAATVVKTYTDPYTHIKVQVKAAGAGSQGTLTTRYFGTWI